MSHGPPCAPALLAHLMIREMFSVLALGLVAACSSPSSSAGHDHGGDAGTDAAATKPSCEKLHVNCESAVVGEAEECHNLAHSATATEADCAAALDRCLAACGQAATDAGVEDVKVEPSKDAATEAGECKKSGTVCTSDGECCSKMCHSHGGTDKECH